MMTENMSAALIALLLAKSFAGRSKGKSAEGICRRIDDRVLNEADRQILKRRYIDGLTYERLAAEFNFSVPGIKKRIYKYRDML